MAALQIEESDPALDYHLNDAERLVLNVSQAEARATALSLLSEVVGACVDALKAVAGIQVHSGISDFYDEYAREALEQAIADGESTAMAMADSNAMFPD